MSSAAVPSRAAARGPAAGSTSGPTPAQPPEAAEPAEPGDPVDPAQRFRQRTEPADDLGERGGELGVDLVGQRHGGSGLPGPVTADKRGAALQGGHLGEPDHRHEQSQPVGSACEGRFQTVERVAEPRRAARSARRAERPPPGPRRRTSSRRRLPASPTRIRRPRPERRQPPPGPAPSSTDPGPTPRHGRRRSCRSRSPRRGGDVGLGVGVANRCGPQVIRVHAPAPHATPRTTSSAVSAS